MARVAPIAVVVCALVATACGRRAVSSTPALAGAEPELGRFPHAGHAALECTDCHAAAAVALGVPARPGADDHAPCDRDQCHRDAFLAAPGPLCGICHDDVDPTGARPTTLAPYPPSYGPRILAAEFSHRVHTDYSRMDAAVGFHIACDDCHARADHRPDPTPPSHAVCTRCHADEAAPAGAPPIRACRACHRERQPAPNRRRTLIVGDLRFAHADHAVDARGARIACVECHDTVASFEATGAHPPPATRVCVTCHDDANRTPVERRMRVCETCHADRAETFSVLAPRSHLPAAERPANHTLAFRSDHALEAEANASACARCHATMSGSPRDTCDDCHQVMRPRDHVVGWNEWDHGPAAATDASRCETCHAGGFCVACHSRPPRSHFPLAAFARGGHAEPAALELRACLVCHPAERDCAGLACHERGPP
jgi:hypothetical protein